jgi:glycerol 3-phosphatase-2
VPIMIMLRLVEFFYLFTQVITNEVYVVSTKIKQVKIPAANSLELNDVIEIYQALRPAMPLGKMGKAKPASRLIDLLDEFDGLVLDGYGVINVGDSPIDGIATLLDAAAGRDKPVLILTNGGSFSAEHTWKKYQDWRLPIARDDVISSRDALVFHANSFQPGSPVGAKVGCFGRSIEVLAGEHILAYGRDDDFWQQADEFAFLGALDWTEDDQATFEAAMLEDPRPLHIANPDVGAPQMGGRFSAEPGYWTLRMMQAAANQGVKIDVRWYGKPYGPAFDLALSRMQIRLGNLSGRQLDRPFEVSRIAMVGDSLHTDILGGGAVGMTTVLISDHGLFRGQDVMPFCKAGGLFPDWIVKTL